MPDQVHDILPGLCDRRAPSARAPDLTPAREIYLNSWEHGS
ncbi:hypothetical protein [Frankia sp. Cr2]|nr:hypothetical protein [Frankia sp. Cr2]